MTGRPVEVWLFYPEKSHHAVGNATKFIKAECVRRQWLFQERPTRLIKKDGRPIGAIKPEDATNLYKRIHRARVGVWQIEYADAPILPQPKNVITHYITLKRFVLHKAYHSKLPNKSMEDSWASSLGEFLAWMKEARSENEGDPRCLPFHVFDAEQEIVESLELQEGRQRFAEGYGAQSSRCDRNGLRWLRGPLHGHDVIQVAGRELAAGFHWDVNGKTKQRVVTTSDVWEFKPNGYVNVYPDAHVRGSSKAKRVYP